LIAHTTKALKVFQNPHFSFYKTYINRDKKLVVLLNPKVGSTAFREVLVNALQEKGIQPIRSRLWPMNLHRRYITAPLKDYIHAFSHQEEYEFYAFVRNPYARALSAWNDKLVKGFYAPRYPKSMRKLIKKLRHFALEHQIEGSDTQQPFPFASFITYIESQHEGTRNQHWDTQYVVLSNNAIHFTQIYKMETAFITGMVKLLEKLEIEEQWIKEQLAQPRNASGEITFPHYTPELAQRVYTLYQKDFIEYGYDKDSWQSL